MVGSSLGYVRKGDGGLVSCESGKLANNGMRAVVNVISIQYVQSVLFEILLGRFYCLAANESILQSTFPFIPFSTKNDIHAHEASVNSATGSETD
jgi:hypothetical protein